MKKLFFLACIFSSFIASAQYEFYKDSTFNQSWTLLSNTTSVNNGQYWNKYKNYEIPIGFTFKFFGQNVDTLYMNQNLGDGAWFFTRPRDTNSTFGSAIVAHGSSLSDRDSTFSTNSVSPISYSVSGSAPNRIFKIQWINAGFLNAIFNGNNVDSVNFQLWLHETSNNIDVLFGDGNYVSANPDLYGTGSGPNIAIFDSLNFNDFMVKKYYYFNGNITSPYLDSLTDLGNISASPSMSGNPTSGDVFRFMPLSPNTNVGYISYLTHQKSNVNYYNKSNELKIDILVNDDYHYVLANTNGAIISQGALQKGQKLINTSNLATGIYILKLISNSENYSTKFIK